MEFQSATSAANKYLIGHSPLRLFRTNVNRQWYINTGRRQTSWIFTSVYSRQVELGATETNISWRSERDLNLWPTDIGALTTRSCYLSGDGKKKLISCRSKVGPLYPTDSTESDQWSCVSADEIIWQPSLSYTCSYIPGCRW